MEELKRSLKEESKGMQVKMEEEPEIMIANPCLKEE